MPLGWAGSRAVISQFEDDLFWQERQLRAKLRGSGVLYRIG